MHNRKGRGLSPGHSSDDSDGSRKLSGRKARPHDDDDEEEEEESEDEDEEDEDEEPSVTTEGAYDPAEYANLPVSTEIKDLFQYITR